MHTPSRPASWRRRCQGVSSPAPRHTTCDAVTGLLGCRHCLVAVLPWRGGLPRLPRCGAGWAGARCRPAVGPRPPASGGDTLPPRTPPATRGGAARRTRAASRAGSGLRDQRNRPSDRSRPPAITGARATTPAPASRSVRGAAWCHPALLLVRAAPADPPCHPVGSGVRTGP